MVSTSTRASRAASRYSSRAASRYSSPAQPGQHQQQNAAGKHGASPASAAEEGKGTVGATQGSRGLMARWLEPSLQSKASFEEAGLQRYGVLESMSALGTMPSKATKAAGSAESSGGTPAVRKIILRPSGSHIANARESQIASAREAAKLAAREDSSPPPVLSSEAELRGGPPLMSYAGIRAKPPVMKMAAGRRKSLAAKVDKAMDKAVDKALGKMLDDAADDDDDDDYEYKAKDDSEMKTKHRRRSKRVSLPSNKMGQLLGAERRGAEGRRGSGRSEASVLAASPSKTRSRSSSTQDREFVDKVVDIAVGEALQHHRYPTAWALRSLYDDKYHDCDFVGMVEEVFRQTAHESTRLRFLSLVEGRKREGKRSNRSRAYFAAQTAASASTWAWAEGDGDGNVAGNGIENGNGDGNAMVNGGNNGHDNGDDNGDDEHGSGNGGGTVERRAAKRVKRTHVATPRKALAAKGSVIVRTPASTRTSKHGRQESQSSSSSLSTAMSVESPGASPCHSHGPEAAAPAPAPAVGGGGAAPAGHGGAPKMQPIKGRGRAKQSERVQAPRTRAQGDDVDGEETEVEAAEETEQDQDEDDRGQDGDGIEEKRGHASMSGRLAGGVAAPKAAAAKIAKAASANAVGAKSAAAAASKAAAAANAPALNAASTYAASAAAQCPKSQSQSHAQSHTQAQSQVEAQPAHIGAEEDPFWNRRRQARTVTNGFVVRQSLVRGGHDDNNNQTHDYDAARDNHNHHDDDVEAVRQALPAARSTRQSLAATPTGTPSMTQARATRSASKRPASIALDSGDAATVPLVVQGHGSALAESRSLAESSRAATPTAKRARTGLRVKTSPVKKKGGTAAGLPRPISISRAMSEALGAAPNSANNANTNTHSNKDAQPGDNDEHCSACGNTGDVVCCDGCPRSFHFECVDMVPSHHLPDEWFCNECLVRRFPARVPVYRGVFGSALNRLEKSNPRAFSLPSKLQTRFDGVRAGVDGDYEDLAAARPPARKRNGYDDLPDLYKQRHDGHALLCHACNRAAGLSRALIPCSLCPLHWHLDCLDPPLAVPPLLKTWRCPAHADHVLSHAPRLAPAHRFRKVKGSQPITPALSRGVRNNGHIEVEWTDQDQHDSNNNNNNKSAWPDPASFGRSYKLPAKALILDFVEQLRLSGAGYAAPRKSLPPWALRDDGTPLRGSALQCSVDEAQVSLTLAALGHTSADKIDMLLSALMSSADPALLSLMAKANAANMALGPLTNTDKQSLRAMLAQMDAMTSRIRHALGDDDGNADKSAAQHTPPLEAHAPTPLSSSNAPEKIDAMEAVAEPTPPSTVDHADEGSMDLD